MHLALNTRDGRIQSARACLFLSFFFSTNSGVNPGQPAGKRREKKTVVLTLGSPPEKGEKKRKEKPLVLTLGSPPEKDGEKKKKNPDINPGQPAEKGRKKKKIKKKKTVVLTLGSPPEKVQKKKPLVLTLGSSPEKAEKKKKTPVSGPRFRTSVSGPRFGNLDTQTSWINIVDLDSGAVFLFSIFCHAVTLAIIHKEI